MPLKSNFVVWNCEYASENRKSMSSWMIEWRKIQVDCLTNSICLLSENKRIFCYARNACNRRHDEWKLNEEECKSLWTQKMGRSTTKPNDHTKTHEPPDDKTNKMACAPNEDSHQPGHPPSPNRVLAVRIKKAWVLSYPLSAQQRLWSDRADAQADLCWAHSHFVGFVMRRLIVDF